MPPDSVPSIPSTPEGNIPPPSQEDVMQEVDKAQEQIKGFANMSRAVEEADALEEDKKIVLSFINQQKEAIGDGVGSKIDEAIAKLQEMKQNMKATPTPSEVSTQAVGEVSLVENTPQPSMVVETVPASPVVPPQETVAPVAQVTPDVTAVPEQGQQQSVESMQAVSDSSSVPGVGVETIVSTTEQIGDQNNIQAITDNKIDMPPGTTINGALKQYFDQYPISDAIKNYLPLAIEQMLRKRGIDAVPTEAKSLAELLIVKDSTGQIQDSADYTAVINALKAKTPEEIQTAIALINERVNSASIPAAEPISTPPVVTA